MLKNRSALYIIGIALVTGFLTGTFAVMADTSADVLNRARESYNNRSLPSREDLMSELPDLPTSFPLDQNVAREQGARELQAMDLRRSENADTIMTQMNSIGAESANPNRLLGDLPSPVTSLGNSVLPTDAESATSTPSSGPTNSPSDPLGQNPTNADAQQSSLTRTARGDFPNGALDVASGDPVALSTFLNERTTADVVNSSNNYNATKLALALQMMNRLTASLAGKMDEVNDKSRQLNEHAKDLAEQLNTILEKLPTIPRQ